jgi:hypothetical protein
MPLARVVFSFRCEGVNSERSSFGCDFHFRIGLGCQEQSTGFCMPVVIIKLAGLESSVFAEWLKLQVV